MGIAQVIAPVLVILMMWPYLHVSARVRLLKGSLLPCTHCSPRPEFLWARAQVDTVSLKLALPCGVVLQLGGSKCCHP